MLDENVCQLALPRPFLKGNTGDFKNVATTSPSISLSDRREGEKTREALFHQSLRVRLRRMWQSQGGEDLNSLIINY